MPTTSLSLSKALKQHLRDVAGLNDGEGVKSVRTLHGALLYILENPYDEPRSLSGYEKTLNDPIKVSEQTLSDLKTLRDQTGARDYKEAIRERANIEPRDVGETPVDVSDL